MNKDSVTLLEELCSLIGLCSWKTISSPNCGKWSGTTSYGVEFSNGAQLWISTGMRDFHAELQEKVDHVRTFHANKESYFDFFRTQSNVDNHAAIIVGYNEIEVQEVSLHTENNGHFLWPFVKIIVGGNIPINHVTTNLSYAMKTNTLDSWPRKIQGLWAAGGVENPDYIFGGVSFSTTDDLYKLKT